MKKQITKEHACPICGQMTKKPLYCSQRCYWDSLKTKPQKSSPELEVLDNTNRCFQCGKPMPLNRYSAYCEECELRIVMGEDD